VLAVALQYMPVPVDKKADEEQGKTELNRLK